MSGAQALEMEWFAIRDLLLGENLVEQNVQQAFKMAAACDHQEARWLSSISAGKDVVSLNDARELFSAAARKEDHRGRFFSHLLGFWTQLDHVADVRRSAELGYAFAQAYMARKTKGLERFLFAESAAAQGEREGFYWLGHCYRVGEACKKNLDKAKRKYLRAAEMSLVIAMSQLGHLLEESDPERWRWWGRARLVVLGWVGCFSDIQQSVYGDAFAFLNEFSDQVSNGPGRVVFAIGRALIGQVNLEEHRIFKNKRLFERNFLDFEQLVEPARRAIAFHGAQLKACRRAVDAWTHVGRALKVAKDIRKLIAILVWEGREEGEYQV